jgi:predicted ATPase
LLSVLAHFFEHGRWGSPVQMGVEGQSLTPEDELFILMQAGLYLTATRGPAAPEIRICYERAEPLCHSLNRPLQLYMALLGQWRYSLNTDKLTATMQVAERFYSLAQEQNDSALMMGACHALACTLYHLGDFESARRNATRGVQICRSGGLESPAEDSEMAAVCCLCYKAITEWHLGEIASWRASITETISLANELNDRAGLAVTLWHAAVFAYYEGNPAEVERFASDLIELSTRHFAPWLPQGEVLRGWARSTSGDTAEGISRIEDAIRAFRANGSLLGEPFFLALKAEALFLADCTSEALETLREAEALVKRFAERYWCTELHRLRDVFLAAVRADETKIEASLCEAIRIAKEQKSVSLDVVSTRTMPDF